MENCSCIYGHVYHTGANSNKPIPKDSTTEDIHKQASLSSVESSKESNGAIQCSILGNMETTFRSIKRFQVVEPATVEMNVEMTTPIISSEHVRKGFDLELFFHLNASMNGVASVELSCVDGKSVKLSPDEDVEKTKQEDIICLVEDFQSYSKPKSPIIKAKKGIDRRRRVKKSTRRSSRSERTDLARSSSKLNRRSRTKTCLKQYGNCRYCGSPCRTIDKHRDDGKFALQCRKRSCLRFNGFVDCHKVLSRNDKLMKMGIRILVATSALPNLQTDTDILLDRKLDINCHLLTSPTLQNGELMVHCPGQKKLCRLL